MTRSEINPPGLAAGDVHAADADILRVATRERDAHQEARPAEHAADVCPAALKVAVEDRNVPARAIATDAEAAGRIVGRGDGEPFEIERDGISADGDRRAAT